MRHLVFLTALAMACATPTRNGQGVSPATYQSAEQSCREKAIDRYGPPPPESRRPSEQSGCDPKSWLCRRTEAWMMKADNPLSDATPWERTVHRSVRNCMQEQGYSLQ